MEKTAYNSFINEIKQELNSFLFTYDVVFDLFTPQHKDDDLRYMINLGEKYGKVNILLESFDNIPTNEKDSNTYSIHMWFWNCNENHKKAFKLDCGLLNDEKGTLILFSKENGLESLKNDFREVLKIWSQELKEKQAELPLWRICLN